jgi:hypothetical protein
MTFDCNSRRKTGLSHPWGRAGLVGGYGSVRFGILPRIFKENRRSRLYGWLMDEYMTDPKALQRDLPHRTETDWTKVSKNIGWITFEDCERILPRACQWLSPPIAPA